MSNFEKPLPEWNAKGIEPPQSKRNEGWKEGDKPPAPWHNWWMHTTYMALDEIRKFLDELEVVTKWEDIEGKPTSFPPSSHKHSISDVTDLQTELNKKETPEGAQEKADKALSTAKTYAIPKTEKGVANGVAAVNSDGKVVDADGNEVEGKVTSVNGQTGDVNIDVSTNQTVVDMRINLIDVAIELETMKAADLTGVDANIFIETFQNLDDIVLERGGYDSVNKRLEV